MHRRSLLRRGVAVGTLALAGCTGDGASPDGGNSNATRTPGQTGAGSTEQQPVTLSGPPCDSIDGATFQSIEEQPGGPGPGGTPVQTYWTVIFEDGRFEYSHTDVVESGPYTCTVEDGVAKLTASRDTAPTLTGTYDPETGVLQWDGVRYRPVEREARAASRR